MIFSLLAASCAHVPIPEASSVAMSYYYTKNLLWALEWLFLFAFPLIFLWTGFSARLASLTKRWLLGIFLYLVVFVLLYQLFQLPLSYYADYIVEHKYGLSSQTFGRWFSNYAIGALLALSGALAFVWLFYLLIKKSPTRWWLYSSLLLIGIEFTLTFVQPVFIDPLFNKFGPMKDKHLEKKILELASSAGIENSRVFEVDKSKDTKTKNAYVTGFGSSGRIVFWDTILKGESEDSILFVTGHEIGHYVLHHIWYFMLYSFASTFLVFYLVYRVSNVVVHRYRRKVHFGSVETIASLPLLILLISLFSFVSLPLNNYLSRIAEHQADIYGLNLTHNNEGAAKFFAKIAEESLMNPSPGPLYVFFRASHPPIAERIAFANSYCPWKESSP